MRYDGRKLPVNSCMSGLNQTSKIKCVLVLDTFFMDLLNE